MAMRSARLLARRKYKSTTLRPAWHGWDTAAGRLLGRGMVEELHRVQRCAIPVLRYKMRRGGRRGRRSFVFRAQRFCYRADCGHRWRCTDVLTIVGR